MEILSVEMMTLVVESTLNHVPITASLVISVMTAFSRAPVGAFKIGPVPVPPEPGPQALSTRKVNTVSELRITEYIE
jgi:hypothetical protein